MAAGTVTELLKQAMNLHQRGDLAAAQRLYEQALEADPGNVNALTNLATLHLQKGDFASAVPLLEESLLHAPRQPMAHNNLGCALDELGRHDDAVAAYDDALALDPGYVDAHVNRGNSLRRIGRLDEALAAYDAALSIAPGHPEALGSRGAVLGEAGRHAEAVACFDTVLARFPDDAGSRFNRASALRALRRYDEALSDYDRLLQDFPSDIRLLNSRGNVLRALGRREEALAAFDAALAVDDGLAEVHLNRAAVLQGLQIDAEALRSCDRAAEIDSGNAAVQFRRGTVLSALKRHPEAIAAYDRAYDIDPDYDNLAGARVHAKQQICDWTGLEDGFRRVAEGVEAGRAVTSPFDFLAMRSSPVQQRRCAEIHVAGQLSWQADIAPPGPYDHDRIRIGYFSSDFRDHPVGYLVMGLIDNHDRDRFEVTGFNIGPPTGDAMYDRFVAAFDRFIEGEHRSDADIARLAREHEIDIAVDLNGLTAGARTRIFAARAAPVQVNYLGYPGTMSAPFIDYIVVDPVVVPPGYRDGFAENIAILPDSYQANDPRRPIRERDFTRSELGLPEDGFVFCCFNNAFKIEPETFGIWMRLLDRVPGSVLWLYAANPVAEGNLRREAEARGVSADRLVFAERMSLADHLARHRAADLGLDTRYYNGHTTTSDALWAGLPVITCPGETFASRVAASLLTAAGLSELVTASWEEYEALATSLATDRPRLKGIGEKLAAGRESCPLFDAARHARGVENAYAEMWTRNRLGQPPTNIVVERDAGG